MPSTNKNVNLFIRFAELPLDIIAIIVDYLPKCELPQLLYFPPIRRTVASAILSDVESTGEVTKHQGSDKPGVRFSECGCTHISFQPESLKKGVNQWKIFPKVVHLEDFFLHLE